MVKGMVKILFPATKNIDEVVGIIDKYGMRGMLKMALQIIGNGFKIKKDKEPK